MVEIRKDRHDAIRDLIFGWIRSHNLQVEREVPLRKLQVNGILEQKAKVMDIVFILANQLTWIDVTIVNGNTEVKRASGEKNAADVAATAKTKKYAANVTNQHAVLLPAGLEAHGGFSKSFLQIIDLLVTTACPCSSRFALEQEKQNLMTSIAVALVKGNHNMVQYFSNSFLTFTTDRGTIGQINPNAAAAGQQQVNSNAAAAPPQPRTDETSESQSSLAEPAPSALGELVGLVITADTRDTNFSGLLIQTDGAAKNNPAGPAGAGAVCFETTEGRRTQLNTVSYFLGDPKSNNVAEYEGLLLGLKLAFDALTNSGSGLSRNVRFESDSQLMVDQLNGTAQCRHVDLLPLFARARDEIFHLKNLPNVHEVELLHIRRGLNQVADLLASSAANNPLGTGFSSLDHPSFATSLVYEVEKFMGIDGGNVLVQWKGFPEEADFTWQLESDLITDLGRVTFHTMMQEHLMSQVMEEVLEDYAQDQEHVNNSATEHVVPAVEASPAVATDVTEPSSTSTPRVQSATVAGPNTGNTSLAANVGVPLVRRFSARVRERQARCCLSRAPSAP
jgi:ribonuclease HI